MKKSSVVTAPLLAAAAVLISGCGSAVPPIHVHLNETGQCISSDTNFPVDQRICYGYGGGYYGGAHYMYIPYESAPYYRNPGSVGYVRPWTSASRGFAFSNSASVSGTVRGTFGGSAASGGE